MGAAPVDAGGRGSCVSQEVCILLSLHLHVRIPGPSLSIVMVTGWAPHSEGGRGSVQVTQLWSSLS